MMPFTIYLALVFPGTKLQRFLCWDKRNFIARVTEEEIETGEDITLLWEECTLKRKMTAASPSTSHFTGVGGWLKNRGRRPLESTASSSDGANKRCWGRSTAPQALLHLLLRRSAMLSWGTQGARDPEGSQKSRGCTGKLVHWWCVLYPTASSLFNCAFRALRTSRLLASLETAGSYALNLRFGAPQTGKSRPERMGDLLEATWLSPLSSDNQMLPQRNHLYYAKSHRSSHVWRRRCTSKWSSGWLTELLKINQGKEQRNQTHRGRRTCREASRRESCRCRCNCNGKSENERNRTQNIIRRRRILRRRRGRGRREALTRSRGKCRPAWMRLAWWIWGLWLEPAAGEGSAGAGLTARRRPTRGRSGPPAASAPAARRPPETRDIPPLWEQRRRRWRALSALGGPSSSLSLPPLRSPHLRLLSAERREAPGWR